MMNEKKADFLGDEPTYKKGGIIMFNKMKLKMKKVMKNQKGMTLIELLAVLVIIAIVALIAVPAIGNIIQNSKDRAILSDASQIISGAKIAITDGACDGGTTAATACNKDNLTKYVELDKSYDSYLVKKDASTGAYSIQFSGFANVKNTTKYTNTAGKTATTDVTASNLAADLAK
ncbi:type IV pilus assembly protein PilA [Rummeliibacillus stabekisii]|nr:type IV pilus assembly protein PilA [Rummeliibacillus stabekisii]